MKESDFKRSLINMIYDYLSSSPLTNSLLLFPLSFSSLLSIFISLFREFSIVPLTCTGVATVLPTVCSFFKEERQALFLLIIEGEDERAGERGREWGGEEDAPKRDTADNTGGKEGREEEDEAEEVAAEGRREGLPIDSFL
jgi:hypothetical protein